MANDLDQALKQFQNIEKQLQKKVSGFNVPAGQVPSAQALQSNIELIKAQNAQESIRSSIAKSQIAGYKTEEQLGAEKSEKGGYIGRTLDLLGLPLYGVVGGVEAVLGKGTKKGLANIPANIREKELFGDLLRKYNITNKAFTIPMGFALDVLFDPINWATAGTAALLPKIAYGASKAGLKGAVTGAKASALGKAAFTTKFIPGIKKLPKIKGLTKSAEEARVLYNKQTGRDIMEILSKEPKARQVLSEIGKVIEKVPGGKSLVNNFVREPKNWFVTAMRKSAERQNLSKELVVRIGETGDIEGLPLNKALDVASKKVGGELDVLRGQVTKNMNEGALAMTDMQETTRSFNANERAFRTMGEVDIDIENREYIQDIIRQFEKAKKAIPEKVKKGTLAEKVGDAKDRTGYRRVTGLDWYDDMIHGFEDISIFNADKFDDIGIVNRFRNIKLYKSVKTDEKIQEVIRHYDEFGSITKDQRTLLNNSVPKIGEGIMKSYEDFIFLFKQSKIGLSPSTWANAILGNPIMAHLAGINIVDPEFLRHLKMGRDISLGKIDQNILDYIQTSDWNTLMRNYPDLVRAIFGVNPGPLLNKNMPEIAVREYIKKYGIKLSEDVTKDTDQVIRIMANMDKNLTAQAKRDLRKGKIGVIKEELGSPVGMMKENEKFSTSYISSELGAPRLVKKIDDALGKNPNSLPLKAMQWYLTKPIEAYEKIDQSFKIGISLYLSRAGITEGELLKLRRLVKIGPRDILLQEATETGRYRLKAIKSLEVANEIYMNYAALPGAIKALRSLPVMGHPFASFAYLMATKTGKALVYNPAAFNKVQFFLKELSGGKSPLEQKALTEPYYQWYNRLGMTKLPFFDKNPLYLNLANMIPYYSMNLFEPTDRSYDERVGGTITAIRDSLPLMKDPLGTVIWDYLIQPAILRESNPKGAFDQMLWPTDAGALEKTGYAARQLAESVIPNVAALPLAVATPGGYLESLPLYSARKIGFAARGKTASGVIGKEPTVQRTARAIASVYAGLSFYQLKTSYAK